MKTLEQIKKRISEINKEKEGILKQAEKEIGGSLYKDRVVKMMLMVKELEWVIESK